MEAGAKVNSPEYQLRKYAMVTGIIAEHKAYGLLLVLENGDEGFADSSDVADIPVSADDWPPVGESVRAVVLGPTRIGRVRLSLRRSDVEVVAALNDPEVEFRNWEALMADRSGNAIARDAFFASFSAVPLLRWALARPQYSADRKLAEELLVAAPRTVKEQLNLPE